MSKWVFVVVVSLASSVMAAFDGVPHYDSSKTRWNYGTTVQVPPGRNKTQRLRPVLRRMVAKFILAEGGEANWDTRVVLNCTFDGVPFDSGVVAHSLSSETGPAVHRVPLRGTISYDEPNRGVVVGRLYMRATLQCRPEGTTTWVTYGSVGKTVAVKTYEGSQ